MYLYSTLPLEYGLMFFYIMYFFLYIVPIDKLNIDNICRRLLRGDTGINAETKPKIIADQIY